VAIQQIEWNVITPVTRARGRRRRGADPVHGFAQGREPRGDAPSGANGRAARDGAPDGPDPPHPTSGFGYTFDWSGNRLFRKEIWAEYLRRELNIEQRLKVLETNRMLSKPQLTTLHKTLRMQIRFSILETCG
jgi:hypothetical protein